MVEPSPRSDEATARSGEVDDQRRPLVLVVEDDDTVSEVVERYLEREGFSVEVAPDGLAAVERFGHDVDLVVLDIMLPGLDGLEVCRRLRAHSPVPIIMLTALGTRTIESWDSSSAPTTTLQNPFRRVS